VIIFGNPQFGKEVARRAGIGFDPAVDFCIARTKGKLLGGVIYTNYTRRTVQMHMAGFAPRWATPEFMWVIYDFPFNYLGVEKVIATVPSTNARSIDIVFKMGFEHLTSVPGVVFDGDMEIFAMRRYQCRWLLLGPRYTTLHRESAA